MDLLCVEITIIIIIVLFEFVIFLLFPSFYTPILGIKLKIMTIQIHGFVQDSTPLSEHSYLSSTIIAGPTPPHLLFLPTPLYCLRSQ